MKVVTALKYIANCTTAFIVELQLFDNSSTANNMKTNINLLAKWPKLKIYFCVFVCVVAEGRSKGVSF